jgi:hypothetical protein
MASLASMGNVESTVGQARFALIWSRKVVSFLCVCALVYALMMGLWAVWGDAYLRLYCAGANHVFGSLGSRATVYFSQSADTGDEVKVTFYDRQRLDRYLRPTPLLRIAHDVHYGVYIYVAFLIALIIASPVAWRRRAWALLWGLIAVHAFMAIRLALLVAQLLNSKSLALLELSRFWQYLLVLSVQVFVINILPSFVVVIVLWVLLCFRRQDWLTIMMPQKRSKTIHPEALRAPP